MSLTSYTPSNQVQYAHSIPHLNTQFQNEDNSFNYSLSYLESLIPFPGLLLAFSLLLVFGYIFVVLSGCIKRNCCRICCPPSKPPLHPDRESFTERANFQIFRHERNVKRFIFYLFSLFVINFFIWYGDGDANTAYDNLENGIQYVINTFSSVNNAATTMQVDANNMAITSSSAMCTLQSGTSTFYSLISTDINQLISSSASISSTADPISSDVNDFSNSVNNFEFSKKDVVIGCFFSIIIVIISIYISAMYYKEKNVFRVAIALSWFADTAILSLASAVTVIVMFVADFCMDPANNLLASISSQSFPGASFYLTCTGTNPFSDSINAAYSDCNAMQDSLYTSYTSGLISSSCYTTLNADLIDINTQITNIDNSINQCTSLNNAFNSFVNEAVCTNGFNALFETWIILFIIGLTLFLVMYSANSLFLSYVFIITAGGNNNNEKFFLNRKIIENLFGKDRIYTVEEVAVTETPIVSPLYFTDFNPTVVAAAASRTDIQIYSANAEVPNFDFGIGETPPPNDEMQYGVRVQEEEFKS